MIRILIIIFNIIITFNLNARVFEGEIKVVKESIYDTSYFLYTIKDSMIRVEEYNQQNSLVSSIIIDLKNNKIYAVNAAQKLYKEINPKSCIHDQSDFEIIKTDNSKNIQGYNCYQWRVRNKKENSEISYWVARDDFSFYSDMNKLLNNIGNISEFYCHIPDNSGYMPIFTIERTLVRYEKVKMHISSITSKKIPSSLFTIPKDYKPLDN